MIRYTYLILIFYLPLAGCSGKGEDRARARSGENGNPVPSYYEVKTGTAPQYMPGIEYDYEKQGEEDHGSGPKKPEYAVIEEIETDEDYNIGPDTGYESRESEEDPGGTPVRIENSTYTYYPE
ncbi:MAG: hypothetical protein JXJ19_08040 [Elusimicrobia bacterium]|nr:hypothetical protein [Elusimicrobiota bacterium]